MDCSKIIKLVLNQAGTKSPIFLPRIYLYFDKCSFRCKEPTKSLLIFSNMFHNMGLYIYIWYIVNYCSAIFADLLEKNMKSLYMYILCKLWIEPQRINGIHAITTQLKWLNTWHYYNNNLLYTTIICNSRQLFYFNIRGCHWLITTYTRVANRMYFTGSFYI